MAKKPCSYPGCSIGTQLQIQSWGDVYLCKKHYEKWQDLSLMSLKNSSDYKRFFEAECKFAIACGAGPDKQKELKSIEKGSYSRLRELRSSDYFTPKYTEDKWLKSVQDTLDDLKTDIKIWPIVSSEDREKAKKSGKDLPDAKYNRIKCEWCKEMIPRNGAAQFSHLKKHVNQLVIAKKITEEKAKTIRKVKLDPKIKKIFKSHF